MPDPNDDAVRWALYSAWGERCALRGHPKCINAHGVLSFDSMHVDHLIPQVEFKSAGQSATLTAEYGLPAGTGVNDLVNLIPTCDNCNLTKNSTVLPGTSVGVAMLVGKSKAKVDEVQRKIRGIHGRRGVERYVKDLAKYRHDTVTKTEFKQLEALRNQLDEWLSEPRKFDSGIAHSDGTIPFESYDAEPILSATEGKKILTDYLNSPPGSTLANELLNSAGDSDIHSLRSIYVLDLTEWQFLPNAHPVNLMVFQGEFEFRASGIYTDPDGNDGPTDDLRIDSPVEIVLTPAGDVHDASITPSLTTDFRDD